MRLVLRYTRFASLRSVKTIRIRILQRHELCTRPWGSNARRTIPARPQMGVLGRGSCGGLEIGVAAPRANSRLHPDGSRTLASSRSTRPFGGNEGMRTLYVGTSKWGATLF